MAHIILTVTFASLQLLVKKDNCYSYNEK